MDQNLKELLCDQSNDYPFIVGKKSICTNFKGMVYDPRISQIEKIFAKKLPKFLDLYASIYGNSFCNYKKFYVKSPTKKLPN